MNETAERPRDTLRRMGVTPSVWANREVHDGDMWTYSCDHLNSHAIRDLAFLVTEGWDVHVYRTTHRHLDVRVTRRKDS